jgi:predicted CopG family antitoxin
MDNEDKTEKVKVQLDKDVVNELLGMKKVGDTYSDVVRMLLKSFKKGKK